MTDRRSFFKKMVAAPLAVKAALSGAASPHYRSVLGTLQSFEFEMPAINFHPGVGLIRRGESARMGFNVDLNGTTLETGVISSDAGVEDLDPLLPSEENPECPLTTTSVVLATPSNLLFSRFETTPWPSAPPAGANTIASSTPSPCWT